MLLDQRQLWYIWKQSVQRLTTWVMALLQGRRYTIRLETEGTGYHAPVQKIIQVNPQLFADQPVELQFRATQGLLAHECAHAWFTGSWPDQEENVLQELTNILEDQRVERCIGLLYPGVKPAIRLTGDLVYARMGPASRKPKEAAYTCCLAWRWAYDRTSQEEMFSRLQVSPEDQMLWAQIRALVEQAWHSPDTDSVIRLAREILKILGMPFGVPRLGLVQVNPQDIPTHGGSILQAPAGPADAAPGLGTELGEGNLPKIQSRSAGLTPGSYLDLEESVRSRSVQLAEALKEPRPEQRAAPHEYRGRYSFRQDIRTPDTPHLAHQDVGLARRSLALYMLVDRSGSMDRYEQAVREALMTIYLAAVQVGIPIGIACFGEDDFYTASTPLHPDKITVERVVAEITPVIDRLDEAPKSLIAGYTGWASNEYLDWGLRKAETELKSRSERLRVLIIITDGDPVYRYRSLVSDWNLSMSHLRSLERQGVTPIGVFLGSDNLEKMKMLFSRLVICAKGNDLPEKLGRLLSSLA